MASDRTEDIIISLSTNGKSDAVINGDSEITITPDVLIYGTLPDVDGVIGYTFDGWYFDDLCTDGPVTEETEITSTESHTLYAKWTPINIEISFNNNGIGTSEIPSQTVTYDNEFGSLPSLSEKGYEFGGWYTNSSCTDNNKITDKTISDFTTDTILYAKWTPISVTITYNNNGIGSINSESKNVTYDSTFGQLATGTATGYTFGGWFTDPECNEENRVTETSVVKLTTDTIVYAKWTPITITITFDNRGIGDIDILSKDVTYDSEFGTLANATATEYTFDGWFTDPECFNKVTSNSIVKLTENTTLYAGWTVIEIVVTFNNNGIGESEIEPLLVFCNSTFSPLPTLSSIGYTFKGWYTDPECSDGNEITESTPASNFLSNLTLYAKWERDTITIKFDNNGYGGTTHPEPIIIYYGETIENLPILNEIGHIFGGWYTDPECTDGNEVFGTTVSNFTTDTILYAKWTPKTIEVIFNNNGYGGITPESTTVYYGESIQNLPIINEVGYEFGGWYTDINCTGDKVTPETVIETNKNYITLYAKWVANTIEIKFKTSRGTTPEPITIVYGGTIQNLPTFNNIGEYTFSGWYENEKYTGDKVTTETIIKSDKSYITLYAKWELRTINVYFETEHGEIPDPIPVKYGETIDKLPIINDDEHVFLGWYDNKDYTGDEITIDTKIKSSSDEKTLYAKWGPIEIGVSFDNMGLGLELGMITVSNGGSIENLPILSEIGYIFGGWYTDLNCTDGNEVISTTIIKSDSYIDPIILYAKWTPITITVVFDSNGHGTPSIHSTTALYNDTIRELATISESGYTFLGWYDNKACKGEQITNETIITTTESLTLYAKWDDIEYTVTFNVNGNINASSSKESIVVSYGSLYGELATIEGDNKGFVGWYDNPDCIGKPITKDSIVKIASNHILYAKWYVESYRLKVVSDPSKIGFTSTPIVKVDKYDTYTLPTPTKVGYRLVGWDVVRGNSYITNKDDVYTLHMVNKDTEVHAKWEAKLYNINLDINGGEYDSSLELTEIRNNESVILEDPVKTGYKFIGWSDNMDNTYTSPFNMPDEDLTLTAQFEPLVCTVYFSVAGIGTLPTSSIEVTYGSAYGTLPTPTAENHTFGGWYETPECDGEAITESSVLEEEVTTKRLYAKWTLKSGASDSSLNTSLTMNYALFMLTKEEVSDPSKTGWSYAYANSHRWVKLNALLKEQLVDPDWSRDTLAFVYGGIVYDIYKDYIDCDSGTRVFILKPSVRGSDCITF